MLLTALLLPLAASAAVLSSAAPAAANIVIEKLEPKYRKTANRARYKLGRTSPVTFGPTV
jgi:phosphate-selective porin